MDILSDLIFVSSSELHINLLLLLILYFHAILDTGSTLLYMPSFSIINLRFEDRKSLATGIMTMGAGLGGCIGPLLFQFLYDLYGYSGSLMLICALSMNCGVCGFILNIVEAKKVIPIMNEKETVSDTKHQEVSGDLLPNLASQQIDTLEKTNTESEEINERNGFSNKLKKLIICRMDTDLFHNSSFVFLLLVNGLYGAIYFYSTSFMVAFALDESHDVSVGVSVLAIGGLSDIIARATLGLFMDFKLLRDHRPELLNFFLLLGSSGLYVVDLYLYTFKL